MKKILDNEIIFEGIGCFVYDQLTLLELPISTISSSTSFFSRDFLLLEVNNGHVHTSIKTCIDKKKIQRHTQCTHKMTVRLTRFVASWWLPGTDPGVRLHSQLRPEYALPSSAPGIQTCLPVVQTEASSP